MSVTSQWLFHQARQLALTSVGAALPLPARQADRAARAWRCGARGLVASIPDANGKRSRLVWGRDNGGSEKRAVRDDEDSDL
jgi:hypothetical protein